MKPILFLLAALLLKPLAALHAAWPRDTMPDTWVASDALGRVLPISAEVGASKPNRTVGIF